MRTIITFIFSLCFLSKSIAQKPPLPKLTIKGTAGVTYEGYGLTATPSGYNFYPPRRPWNLVRFNFQPVISYGNFKLPINLSFSPMRTNFGAAPFGLGNLPGFPKQTFKQWITNPINSIGFNPSYKWAEVQLGTQYLKYSDLSTGDVGAFGYGFSLKPGNLRLKFFSGINQQAFEPFLTVSPVFGGIYKRRITMGQIGFEQEDKYFVGFNLVKGHDNFNSILAPIAATPNAAENFIVSFNAKIKNARGWYGQTEIATTHSTKNTQATGISLISDYKPFMKTNISSFRDHALQGGFGRKIKDWELGASMKWLGAGYKSMGYPFIQNDRLEYAVNTRFNAFKKKTNVVANLGQRFGNWSVVGSRTKQIIANINLFTQFNDHLSVNANYNNFGFQSASLLGIKNVGNDLGVNPSYVWTSTKMSNLLSLTYNWSKYDETTLLLPPTTNNTHTAMLLYVPTFFDKSDLSPDFSIMYFKNISSITTLNMFSASTGLAWNKPKSKIGLKGQLLYNITSIGAFTPSNNLMATIGGDYKITKNLSWTLSMTGNLNKYGNELTPQPALLGAKYLESTLRTSLQYRLGKQ